MAGLFSHIGSSSFVMQSEYGMSAMQFSLLFGLNGIGLIIAAMIFSVWRAALAPKACCAAA